MELPGVQGCKVVVLTSITPCWAQTQGGRGLSSLNASSAELVEALRPGLNNALLDKSTRGRESLLRAASCQLAAEVFCAMQLPDVDETTQ